MSDEDVFNISLRPTEICSRPLMNSAPHPRELTCKGQRTPFCQRPSLPPVTSQATRERPVFASALHSDIQMCSQEQTGQRGKATGLSVEAGPLPVPGPAASPASEPGRVRCACHRRGPALVGVTVEGVSPCCAQAALQGLKKTSQAASQPVVPGFCTIPTSKVRVFYVTA